MEKAVVYARYSANTKNKDDSVAAQLERIDKVAGSYNIVGTFKEPGKSAWSGKPRPEWIALTKQIAAGEVRWILFDRIDRLNRNNPEAYEFMALCQRQGVKWCAVRDNKTFDLADPMQLMMATWEAIQGAEYSNSLSKATKAGNLRRRNAGEPMRQGHRPYGRNDDRMTMNKAEAKFIRLGRDMLLGRGRPAASLFTVLTEWQRLGAVTTQGKQWTGRGVFNTMTKWSNAAVPNHLDLPLDDVAPDPKWKPIISREDVEEIRALFASRARPRGTGVTTLCGGLIYCRCGQPMVGGGWQGRTNNRIYRCNAYTDNRVNIEGTHGEHSSIARHIVDAAVRERLITIYLVAPEWSGAQAGEEGNLAKLSDDARQVRAQKQQLLDLHLEGSLSKVEYQTKKAQLDSRDAEIESATTKLAAESAHARMLVSSLERIRDVLGEESLGDDAAVGRALSEFTRLEDAFDSLSLEDKRLLIKSTLHVTVNAGRGKQRLEMLPLSWLAALS
jgi:DNA invertase Pin-like site-specific DNA recombinase